MNKQPKQGFAAEIYAAVKEYHEYHGDKQIQPVRFVCDPYGAPMILTRVVGADKQKMSCLLEFHSHCKYENGNPVGVEYDVIERDSIKRKDEYYMLCRFMTGCGCADDDYDPDDDGGDEL